MGMGDRSEESRGTGERVPPAVAVRSAEGVDRNEVMREGGDGVLSYREAISASEQVGWIKVEGPTVVFHLLDEIGMGVDLPVVEGDTWMVRVMTENRRPVKVEICQITPDRKDEFRRSVSLIGTEIDSKKTLDAVMRLRIGS
jgi:hypothetical protein